MNGHNGFFKIKNSVSTRFLTKISVSQMFWNPIKTVYLRGPHFSRPRISRPCCISILLICCSFVALFLLKVIPKKFELGKYCVENYFHDCRFELGFGKYAAGQILLFIRLGNWAICGPLRKFIEYCSIVELLSAVDSFLKRGC